MLAKVKVVLRRFGDAQAHKGPESENKQQPEPYYDDRYLKIDNLNKLVFINGEEKKLTSLEIRLLIYLADNANRLVTKAELFDNVWNDKFTGDGTLRMYWIR